jgi:hypothetical protein
MSRSATRCVIGLLSAFFVPGLLFPGMLPATETPDSRPGASLWEDLGSDLLAPRFRNSKAMRDLSQIETQQQDRNDPRLTQAIQHMQSASDQIEQLQTDRQASAAQSQAIEGLDALLADLTRRKSQCQGGASKPGSQSKPGPPKPGSAGANPDSGVSAASSQSGDLAAELAATAEMVKDLWGHLPERQRQQILQPLGEDFLPRYATEIEQYFRALADPDRRPSESP